MQDFPNIYECGKRFYDFRKTAVQSIELRFLVSCRIIILLGHFGEMCALILRNTISYNVHKYRRLHFNISTFSVVSDNSPSMMLANREVKNNNEILWHYQTIWCHTRGKGRSNLRPSPHFKQQIYQNASGCHQLRLLINNFVIFESH